MILRITTIILLGLLTTEVMAAKRSGRDRSTIDTIHYFYGTIGQGGDELIDPDSGRSLSAGGLLHLSYGARFENEELEDWIIDLRLGYKFDTVEDGQFSRFPFELELQSRINESLGLGFGVTYHISPTYEFSGSGRDLDLELDSAPGFFLSMEYRLDETMSIGGRYTAIEYEKKDVEFLLPGDSDTTDKLDGSSIEFTFLYFFRD